MRGKIFLPPDTQFYQMGVFTIVTSTLPGIMVFDTRYVQLELEPEIPPKPTPTPTPTPETELYKVVSESRLNVRSKHELDPNNIVKRLNPGDEFPLEIGAEFKDETNKILWRKTSPEGYWVAVEREGVTLAQKVDTSARAG